MNRIGERLIQLRLLVLGFCLSWAQAIFSADQSVTLTVDTNRIGIDEQLEATVQFEGGELEGEPQIKGLEQFQVLNQMRSESRTYINGRGSRTTTLTLVLAPLKGGALELGPVSAKMGGQVYSSVPIRIHVEGQKSQPAPEAPEDAEQAALAGKAYFVEAQVSQKEAYVGEAVALKFLFYRKQDFRRAALLENDFKGFISQQLGKEREGQLVLGGQVYKVTELNFMLVPTEVGELEIPAMGLELEVFVTGGGRRSLFDDPFFGDLRQAKKLRIKSAPLKLSVRALPKENKPPQFSGGVGVFQLKAEPLDGTLEGGETASLKLTLEGQGYTQAINMETPRHPHLKFYGGKQDAEHYLSQGQVYGEKQFEWTLVPQKSGDISLDQLGLWVFNPKKKAYEQLKIEPINLSLRSLPNPSPVEQKQGDLSDQKMLPDSSSENNLAQANSKEGSFIPLRKDWQRDELNVGERLIWLGLLALVLIFVVCDSYLGATRSLKLRGPKALIRKKALSQFESQLKAALGAGQPEKAIHALKSFVSTVFGRDVEALTVEELCRFLAQEGLGSQGQAHLSEALALLEAARFAPESRIQNLAELESKLGDVAVTLAKGGSQKTKLRFIIFMLVGLSGAQGLYAAKPWDSAYEWGLKGQWIEADKAWQEVPPEAQASADWHLNRAITLGALGQNVEALYHALEGQRRRPLDPELPKLVLEYQAKFPKTTFASAKPAYERRILTSGQQERLYYLAGLLLLAGLWLRLKKSLRLVLLSLGCVLGIGCVWQSMIQLPHEILIGTQATPLHAGASEANPVLRTLEPGSQVVEVETFDTWVKLRLSDGSIGWAPRDRLVGLSKQSPSK